MQLQAEEKLPQSWRQASWFGVKFCGVFLFFEYAYFKISDDFLRDIVYHQYLVAPCAAVIHLLAPSESVIAQQNLLFSTKTSLEIVRGCDGAGTIFLLLAAILAYASPFKAKLIGLFGGLLALMLVNYVRIIGLYFISAYANNWFTPVHSYIAPTLIILLGCVFYAVWAQYAQPEQS